MNDVLPELPELPELPDPPVLGDSRLRRADAAAHDLATPAASLRRAGYFVAGLLLLWFAALVIVLL